MYVIFLPKMAALIFWLYKSENIDERSKRFYILLCYIIKKTRSHNSLLFVRSLWLRRDSHNDDGSLLHIFGSSHDERQNLTAFVSRLNNKESVLKKRMAYFESVQFRNTFCLQKYRVDESLQQVLAEQTQGHGLWKQLHVRSSLQKIKTKKWKKRLQKCWNCM